MGSVMGMACVPFRVRFDNNNTFRTLERSLLAADTDGYANTESGTTRECAVRGLVKAYRDTSTSHSRYLSQVDLSAAWTGQQRFQRRRLAGSKLIALRRANVE